METDEQVPPIKLYLAQPTLDGFTKLFERLLGRAMTDAEIAKLAAEIEEEIHPCP